jgi:hypothetical protein
MTEVYATEGLSPPPLKRGDIGVRRIVLLLASSDDLGGRFCVLYDDHLNKNTVTRKQRQRSYRSYRA